MVPEGEAWQFCSYNVYLTKRSALAVNCCVIIHCLEVSCKEDQITSAQQSEIECRVEASGDNVDAMVMPKLKLEVHLL